ncbi:MAG: isoprenylcysteine carboxylmethyltransferase family protein [Anaerolineales bacterium]|nr:isoprenylcysteine carboxylmethyltransferase family protein [Anaerolineales bacterium]
MSISTLVLIFAIIVWGFVHSLLASLAAKARVRKWFGPGSDRWYRLAYNMFGILTFMPILGLLAMDPGQTLYVIPAPWSYLALAGQLLAVAALGIGLLQTGAWSFLGIEQLLVNSPEGEAQMVSGGLYRWVRHPLYSAGLVFIWLTPVMTVNLLVLNLGLTIYLVVGAIYEERKLVREFGAAYLEYQEKVPMLIPGMIRRTH